MSVAVIIVAAGRGRRMGGEIPKQYVPLADHCALRLSVEAFLAHPFIDHICTVIHPDDAELCAAALEGVRDGRVLDPVAGGATRATSVLCGLNALADRHPASVLIHDAARPFVPARVIEEMVHLLQTHEGACAGLPVIDALWTTEDGTACDSVPRDGLWRAQTPQGFHFDRIRQAHLRHDGSGADDVAVARESGMDVRFLVGAEENYKITTPADLARARFDLGKRDRSGSDPTPLVVAQGD